MASQPRIDILWQDADGIAVSKPSGVPSIPGRDGQASVLEALAAEIGLPCSGANDPRLRVVHRLDKETSGVLLFAKSAEAQRHFSWQFQHHEVVKQYLALVIGLPPDSSGEIDAPLGRHPTCPQRIAILKHGGRPARTVFRLEEKLGIYSLLRVLPQTGKTHQIRVHLASVGLPLAIDPLYGHDRSRSQAGIFLSSFKKGYRTAQGESERPLIDRLTLHAERLHFADRSGAQAEAMAPLPKDFRAVLAMLRKYGRREQAESPLP